MDFIGEVKVKNGIRRWLIAGAGIIIQLCLGTIYAWSIFKKPLMASHGWSETQTQAAFMIYGLVFAIAVAFGGSLVDRKGPRLVGLLGGTLFGLGILLAGLASHIQNIWLLIAGFGFIAGLGGGFGYVTPITTLIRWFPDKRGLLTGLAVMGYGLGSFFMGNIGPSLIMNIGVGNSFYVWGGTSLGIVLCAALVLRNPPDGWQPAVSSGSNAGPVLVLDSFTFSQAVRSFRFWVLWLMLFVSITAGLGLISQLSPMAQDVMMNAYQEAIPADRLRDIVIASGTIVALGGVCNGLGRLLWSWTSDAIGRKAIFLLLFISMCIGFALLAHVTNVILFTIILCFLLACYGGSMASMPALAADEFGPRHIGKIYGVIFTACGLASLSGPFLFARVKEMTGSFTYALYAESCLAAFGFLLTFLVVRKKRQESVARSHDSE
jgi:OFA family oxalate/formate antiporter-like MFS transporter